MQEDPPTFIPMIEETQEAPSQTQASRREQGLEGFRVFAQDIDDWNSAEKKSIWKKTMISIIMK